MNEKNERIEHIIEIDEFLELRMLIPKRLDALGLKALMKKADKLFNLSSVLIVQEKKAESGSGSKYASKWTEDLIYEMVKLRKLGLIYEDIAHRINVKYGVDFTKETIGSKVYQLKHNKPKMWKKMNKEARKHLETEIKQPKTEENKTKFTKIQEKINERFIKETDEKKRKYPDMDYSGESMGDAEKNFPEIKKIMDDNPNMTVSFAYKEITGKHLAGVWCREFYKWLEERGYDSNRYRSENRQNLDKSKSENKKYLEGIYELMNDQKGITFAKAFKKIRGFHPSGAFYREFKKFVEDKGDDYEQYKYGLENSVEDDDSTEEMVNKISFLYSVGMSYEKIAEIISGEYDEDFTYTQIKDKINKMIQRDQLTRRDEGETKEEEPKDELNLTEREERQLRQLKGFGYDTKFIKEIMNTKYNLDLTEEQIEKKLNEIKEKGEE